MNESHTPQEATKRIALPGKHAQNFAQRMHHKLGWMVESDVSPRRMFLARQPDQTRPHLNGHKQHIYGQLFNFSLNVLQMVVLLFVPLSVFVRYTFPQPFPTRLAHPHKSQKMCPCLFKLACCLFGNIQVMKTEATLSSDL